MQFHPTTLYLPQSKEGAFLISEAVRGFGAELRTQDGTPFMKPIHPLGSLAPRDIVARAIDAEIKRSGKPCVYLDITHKPSRQVRDHFPNIYKKCKKAGIDITRDWIPVVPAAHYMCGGVLVDTFGRTNIQNLFACGETACTGVHGANRLASNSLLEAVVFASRASSASQALVQKKAAVPFVPDWDDSGTVDNDEWIVLSHDFQEIRQLLWDYVGIVRTNHRLRWALRRIRLIANEVEEFYKRTRVGTELVELRNVATVAYLIVLSSLKRKESRGLHYNTDYRGTNNRYWHHNTLLKRP
jgi:L-aspartate oxidase